MVFVPIFAGRDDATVFWRGIAYGVDFDGTAVHAVRARRQHGRWKWVRVPWDDAARSECRAGQAACAVALLQRETLVRWVSTPLTSRRKAVRVLSSLLDVQLPFPVEECVVQFPDIGRTAEGTYRGLAVLARRPDIDKRLAQLQEQGADPVFLDQESLALWARCMVENPPAAAQSAGLRVVVYAGESRWTLVIGRGRTLLSAHTLREWRADQVRRWLLAEAVSDAATQRPVEWLFGGPAVRDVGACHALVRPLTDGLPGPVTLSDDPASLLSRALAWRAMQAAEWPCNFRQAALRHPLLQARLDRRAIGRAAGCLAGGLLLLAMNAGWRAALARVNTERQACLVRSAHAIVGERSLPAGKEVLEAERELAARGKTIAPFVRAFDASLVAALHAVLNLGQEHALQFDTLILRRDAISIRGSATEWDQVGRFVRRLQMLGYTARAEKQEGGTGGVTFFVVNPEVGP